MVARNWKAGKHRYPHIRVVGFGVGAEIFCLCSVCGQESSIPYCAVDLFEKNLAQRGFVHPGDARKVVCPACVEKARQAAVRKRREESDTRKPTVTLAPRLGALLRSEIAEVETTVRRQVRQHFEGIPMPTPATKAEPPRQATPEDRRRISDTLESVYDAKLKRYNDTGSDDVVAAKLKVPRAWVAEVREMFFGPNVNVFRLEAPAKLDDLIGKFTGLSEQYLSDAQRCESYVNELRALKAGLSA